MTGKKRGLGRGLGALLGEIEAVVKAPVAATDASSTTPAEKPRVLPVEQLTPSRFQPRKDIDPIKLHELADSIRAQGLVQPIVVRTIAQQRYEIIAGERRWRAAQLAGLSDVPVVLHEVNDQVALALALIENMQREDLNPLEEAEGLQRLVQEFALTHQQIAEALGKSRATVSNLLRLNDLHPDAKKLLHNGEIEMGHARAILGLSQAQQGEIARKVAKQNLTVRATEALVRQLLQDKPEELRKTVTDPDILRLQDRLSGQLGALVQIKHDNAKGGGSLIIRYVDLDQLEGVIERIR